MGKMKQQFAQMQQQQSINQLNNNNMTKKQCKKN
jgi:hypothetical protein